MSDPYSVTVLMSVFNDAVNVKDAIASILAQTFTSFELLIIDDGSTDDTPAALDAITDPRVRVLRNETNLGLTRSLRRGVEEARGAYIARIDSDDIALPERLARQVAYMEAHPEVGILGSAYHVMDADGNVLSSTYTPGDDLGIRWLILTENPFGHSTVMIRRAVLTEHGLNYDGLVPVAQDYDLWERLLPHTRGANLTVPLVKRRVHAGAVSNLRAELQRQVHEQVAMRALARSVPEVGLTLDELRQIRGFITRDDPLPPREAGHAIRRYLDLVRAFSRHHAEEQEAPLFLRTQVRRVARKCLRFPPLPGWGGALARLTRLLAESWLLERRQSSSRRMRPR